MKRFKVGVLAAACALAAISAPAFAHHSGAMFDRAKKVTIVGTIVDFQYTNPHSWVIVAVPGANGQSTEWGFESEGPSTLLRNGVKHSSILPGEKVTAHAFPMRDGRPAGSLISITKADGSVVNFRGGNGPPPPGLELPKAN